MKKARLNLIVDAVIGAAFLVTALTGVAFLLPVAWQQTVLVGLSFHAWHWLHDWSGAVAAAGVALHLALHWRWVVHTSRRWLADARGELPDRRPAAGRAPTPSRVGPPSHVAQASPHEAPEPRPERASQPQDRSAGRLTRRRFMVGAAGFGAAMIGGVALSRVAAAIGSGQTTAAGGTSAGQGATGSSSSGTTGVSSGASSSGSGASSSGSGTSSSGSGASASGGTTTTTARVVVDSSSCVACGRCLDICPRSVFDWNGAGRATAVSPDSCILCRRCVQVCPASAITLNA